MNKAEYETTRNKVLKKQSAKSQLDNEHIEADSMVKKLQKREQKTGTQLQVVVDEARDVKMPLRVLYEQNKLEYGRSPLWFLQALGSMSLEEIRQFLTENEASLTANEIAASDLILGVVKKDGPSTDRFWRLQEKMLSNKSIQNQVNNIVINSDSAVKSQLDSISEGLFGKTEQK